MRLIDALREIEKCIVGVVNPSWIRLDDYEDGAQISAKNNIDDIIVSAKLAESIEGLSTPIVIPTPESLKVIISHPDYQSTDTCAVILQRSGRYPGRIVFYGKNDAVATISIFDAEKCIIEDARIYLAPTKVAQLVMTINADWKQKFEYWANAHDDPKAAFFWEGQKLYCMIGDKMFDYNLWHCEHDESTGYIPAFEFACKPMLKILSGYVLFKRPAISIYTDSCLKISGVTALANYGYYIPADTPYWYENISSIVYDPEDPNYPDEPRSVMNQRPDGG